MDDRTVARDRMGEIRKRLEKATPGPWITSLWLDGRGGSKPMVAAGGITVAVTHPAPICDTDECEANATLIAHAPDDLRYLLDRVGRLEGLIRDLLDNGSFFISAIELQGVDGEEWMHQAVEALSTTGDGG